MRHQFPHVPSRKLHNQPIASAVCHDGPDVQNKSRAEGFVCSEVQSLVGWCDGANTPSFHDESLIQCARVHTAQPLTVNFCASP